MAVSVLLSLSDAVSLPDLMHFLSYVPEDFDPTQDLRLQFRGEPATNYLHIERPIRPSQD